MKTIRIEGVDYANPPVLEGELRTVLNGQPSHSGVDLQSVTYDSATKRLDILLTPNTVTASAEIAMRAQVNNHLSAIAQVEAVQTELTRSRYAASPLANKTPQQIINYISNQVDGWTGVPAAVKSDLKEWFTILALEIVKLHNREG